MPIDRTEADLLLTTTRTVRRRIDLDRPVPLELLEECVEVAIQAPMSAGHDHWANSAFVIVTDPEKKREIARLYRSGMEQRLGGGASPLVDDDPQRAFFERIFNSSMYLVENLHRVPAIVFPCVRGRPEGEPFAVQAALFGSALPAAWSFMLAARARGLGAAWTTVHLFHEREIGSLLGIPPDWMQAVLLPVGFYRGDSFQRARRPPVEAIAHWNQWAGERTE